jgi:hypothetical protein
MYTVASAGYTRIKTEKKNKETAIRNPRKPN